MINRQKIIARSVQDLKTEREQIASKLTDLLGKMETDSDIEMVEALSEICLYVERIRYIRGISQREIEDEMNYKCLMLKHEMEKKE